VNKIKLAIIGSGDLGRLALQVLSEEQFEVIGFYDDFAEKNTELHGVRVLGTTTDIFLDFEASVFDQIFIAIGYHHMGVRDGFCNKLKDRIPLASIIHKSVVIADGVHIGDGVLIFPGVVIDTGVNVADNVVINAGAVIAHDSKIGQSGFLGPGVTMAGFVDVDARCFVGVGVVIKDNVFVSSDVIIGAGAVVVDNLLGNKTYIGVPAKEFNHSTRDI
jgi:sugar O-acyltransferase (sialic acid O-acetyltransferase NeuD family)